MGTLDELADAMAAQLRQLRAEIESRRYKRVRADGMRRLQMEQDAYDAGLVKLAALLGITAPPDRNVRGALSTRDRSTLEADIGAAGLDVVTTS